MLLDELAYERTSAGSIGMNTKYGAGCASDGNDQGVVMTAYIYDEYGHKMKRK